MKSTLTALRVAAGLKPCRMSAKQLRATNPKLADKWAGFIEANRPQIVAGVAAIVAR